MVLELLAGAEGAEILRVGGVLSTMNVLEALEAAAKLPASS